MSHGMSWDIMGKHFPLIFGPWDLFSHGNGRPMQRPIEVRHSIGIAVLCRLEIKVPLYMSHSLHHFTSHEVNF